MTLSTTPGFYSGTNFDDYVAVRAANNSSLLKLDQSPAHMIAYQNMPQARTEAFHEGQAIHYALLEPEEFDKRYVTGPEGDRRKKEVRDAWKELKERYGEDFVLKPKTTDMISGIIDAVGKHDIAGPILSGPCETEVVALWDDVHDVRCKARIDCMPHGGNTVGGFSLDDCIVDIKSCQDASPDAFAKSVFAYNYFRQADFYLRGCRALKNLKNFERRHFIIIAVEKDPPYGIGVYRIDEGALDAGEKLNDAALAKYAKCTATADFPAYPEVVTDLTLPSWAWSAIDNRLGD